MFLIKKLRHLMKYFVINYNINIYSYRLEHAINNTIRQNITLENKILMIEGTICAVDIHRQAMKFVSIIIIFTHIIFTIIFFYF